MTPRDTTAYIQHLETLARTIADFANAETERLGFAEYADLCELETRLQSLADMLSATEPARFLDEALATAAEHFAYLQTRLVGGPS